MRRNKRLWKKFWKKKFWKNFLKKNYAQIFFGEMKIGEKNLVKKNLGKIIVNKKSWGKKIVNKKNFCVKFFFWTTKKNCEKIFSEQKILKKKFEKKMFGNTFLK